MVLSRMMMPSYPIELIRSKRKTLSVQIVPSGMVIVRAPLKMPENEIQCFLSEKDQWIQKHLSEQYQKRQIAEEKGFFSDEDVQRLKECASILIPPRVAYYAEQLGVSYGRITIRCQRSRWGSCSSKGNLNFNCMLTLMPEPVMDYVVVHELCHRLEMNHSKAFWQYVAQIMPDYKAQRRWLKDNGGALLMRMDGDKR